MCRLPLLCFETQQHPSFSHGEVGAGLGGGALFDLSDEELPRTELNSEE